MLLGTLSGQPPAVTSWPPAGQPRSTPSQPLIAAAVADSVPHQSSASGGNPAPSKPVAPPLILPCTGLLGIPQALVRKITEGRYIDLGDLLPEALEWAFDRSAEDKAPDKDKSRKFPVANITDWVLAFATFMAVSVHFDPSRARPLATYMSIVARLAREVPGQVWQRYDRLFRQAAAVNPALAWDRREPDIWLAATVEHPRPTQSSFGGSRTQGPEAETEICRRYNRGDCYLSSCKFRHLCSICRARSHPARECPLLLRPPTRRPPPRDQRQ